MAKKRKGTKPTKNGPAGNIDLNDKVLCMMRARRDELKNSLGISNNTRVKKSRSIDDTIGSHKVRLVGGERCKATRNQQLYAMRMEKGEIQPAIKKLLYPQGGQSKWQKH